MIAGLFKKMFGSRNERLVKQYAQVAKAINALEPQVQALSDQELADKTPEFKQRIANGELLDSLLPEAFAVVREASKRVLEMRHFDVQLIGGMALHDGKISEMRTGEGKTLVATLPSYLNALSGKGVHIITVNDYLASRDAEWMGRVHRFLGLSVGCNLSQMNHEAKQAAYANDITYGTNNEFGFDYLRDNMVFSPGERVQRKLNYAILDEVDSILIDEARTPLIISGQAEDNVDLYVKVNALAPKLTKVEVKAEVEGEEGPGDYTVDEKAHQVLLTEAGHEHAEELLTQAGLLAPGSSLYDAANILLMHHVYAALRAHALFHRDQHYVVQGGEVVIVDEFTGRLMSGRRWSDGLHQAVEAKEGASIQKENQTLASITFQNYFRLYGKLAGMTGTAATEAYEFQQIYNLETVVIPTHQSMVRQDRMDQVYRTLQEKYAAVIIDIKDCHLRGQPVLVGTTSIEINEFLSELLKKEKLPHQLLNAKQHANEANIVVQAGRPGVITIATNMAGRGTDIVLGGNPQGDIDAVRDDDTLSEEQKHARTNQLRAEWQQRHDQVIAMGGLHIIGTERHESRRVDNQLRGRAGRQGDPGSSRFYLSLEDTLLRIFASDRVASIMDRLKMPEGEAIEHPWVTRAIENAQRKVEARNFDMRKQLLEYDDVANDQRKAIYEKRNELLESEDISDSITGIRGQILDSTFHQFVLPETVAEQWDIAGLAKNMSAEFGLDLPLQAWLDEDEKLIAEGLLNKIIASANANYQAKIDQVGAQGMHHFERGIMLQSLDTHWREHLAALDHLRQGIHLRGYANKNPKQEYKRESFELFSGMLDTIWYEVTRITMTVHIRSPEDVEVVDAHTAPENVQYHHADYDEALGQREQNATEEHAPFVRHEDKVGRNDPCPCGSGKKFKHCHGRLA